jgi:DNA-directed RNA polymerase specialized sigma24 family protein
VATYVKVNAGEVRDVEAYVRRAVVNGSRSHIRRAVVARAYLLTGHRSAQHEDRSVEPAWADDRLEMLAVLSRLPRRMRTVVVLRFYEDLSVAGDHGNLPADDH